MEFLALKCNMSIANFRKVFNVAIGMSPQDYIKKLRLKIAGVLLSVTNQSVKLPWNQDIPRCRILTAILKLCVNSSPLLL
jgi:methylphosphotriester-DNA--protein-cysteine methyltransferase